jgi:hypothetical protein
MSNHIFEENPPAQAPQQIGGAKAQIEKQARQLLYDSRYHVRKANKGKKIDPVNMQRLVNQEISKSTANPAVIARAKQMLNVKEEYIQYMEDSASDLVANALYKVFVEGVSKEKPIKLDYLNELAENPDKKYKVSVYDPKSDTRYVRYATREKITQLRSKGLRVELTEYGDPRESEAKKGSQTAAALGGGKAKKDYDGDGNVESGAKEHAGAVHNAIQRKRGLPADGKDTSSVKEDFIADATTVVQNTKKITGKGVDNSSLVKVFPEDGVEDRAGKSVNQTNVFAHYESDGETISEMSKSKAQRKFIDMIQEKTLTSVEEGAKVDRMVAHITSSEIKSGKSPKKAKNIAWATANKRGMLDNKNKIKEETTCDSSEPERDIRGDYAKKQVIKNKLRAAFGVKNPIVMVCDDEDVKEDLQATVKSALEKGADFMKTNPVGKAASAVLDPVGKGKGTVTGAEQKRNVAKEEVEMIDERRKEDAGTPRRPRDRAVEFLRSRNKGGMMTRSGETVAQHEAKRGVKKDRTGEVNPEPPANPPAKKLAAKKAGAERQGEIGREMQSSRFD